MQKPSGNKHVVDTLFPIALFFSFALCALAVILFAAGIYRSAVDSSTINDTSRTALYYITEKVHQNDEEGMAELTSFQDRDALCLSFERDGILYCTYIYEYGNNLKELLVKAGNEDLVDPASGTNILRIGSLTMDRPADSMLRFTCADEEGELSTTLVHVRSRK